MSFPDDIERLVRMGRARHAEVTGRFIEQLREHGGTNLDAHIAALPPVCRAMAEQIVSKARYYRMSDDEIARAALIANDQCDANASAANAARLDPNDFDMGFPTGFPS